MPAPRWTMRRAPSQSSTSRRARRSRPRDSIRPSSSLRACHSRGRSMICSSTSSRGSTSTRAGQSVSDGADEGEPCADQRLEVQPGVHAIDPGSDGEVHMAVDHQVRHGPGVRAQEADIDTRVPLVEPADGVADVDAPREGRGYCHANGAQQQTAYLSDGVLGLVHLLERGAGGLDQCPPGVGQLGTATPADEQLGPELTFERLQRSRQTRLDHEHPCGGGSETALLHHGKEVLEPSQFHDPNNDRRDPVVSSRRSGVLGGCHRLCRWIGTEWISVRGGHAPNLSACRRSPNRSLGGPASQPARTRTHTRRSSLVARSRRALGIRRHRAVRTRGDSHRRRPAGRTTRRGVVTVAAARQEKRAAAAGRETVARARSQPCAGTAGPSAAHSGSSARGWRHRER